MNDLDRARKNRSYEKRSNEEMTYESIEIKAQVKKHAQIFSGEVNLDMHDTLMRKVIEQDESARLTSVATSNESTTRGVSSLKVTYAIAASVTLLLVTLLLPRIALSPSDDALAETSSHPTDILLTNTPENQSTTVVSIDKQKLSSSNDWLNESQLLQQEYNAILKDIEKVKRKVIRI